MPAAVDIERAKTLCRLLADPRKVRVSIRRHEGEWIVSIFSRDMSVPHAATRGFSATDARPERALLDALAAADGHMPGVDLSMGWSFAHPFGKVTDYEGEHEQLELLQEIADLLNGNYEGRWSKNGKDGGL